MPTIHEHLNNLDRMIDTGAHKPQLVEQVEIIRRIASLNDAEFSDLAQGHAQLQQEHANLKALQTKRNEEGWDSLRKESENQQKLIRSQQLNYKA